MSFLCPTCGKLFTSNHSYVRHLNYGHEEMKFICSLCEKSFTKKKNLQTHIYKVHILKIKKESKTTCSLCNKIIVTKNLKRHMIQKHRPKVNEEERSSRTKCTECSKVILKQNLKRHMKQKHSSVKKSLKCIVCKKVVVSNLKRHMIRKHSPIVDDDRKFQCSICTNKKYAVQTSLNRHMKDMHKVSTTATMKCPLCKISFVNVPKNNPKSIYNHFESKHEIHMKYETYNFKSIDEFYTWKYNIEKETISRFILHLKKSDKLMFKCHRSGKYRSKGCIKRNLKAIGSCKIDGFCPASIKACIVNNGNEVNVTYQQTHVGHQNELRYLTLTTEERKEIAVKLANQASHDEILKGIQGSLTDTPLQRIHLTNKKDIYNIKKSYILNSETVNNSCMNISENTCVQKLET